MLVLSLSLVLVSWAESSVQVGGPLNDQASVLVSGDGIVPFFMTPSEDIGVAQARQGRTRRCDAEHMTAHDSPGETWIAIGLDLTLVPAAGGGRQTTLLLSEPYRYRPNWSLPGMTGTGQTGAPLLCSSPSTLEPGSSARVVVIPLTDAHMAEWRLLDQGDTLRMFEGARVCGHATVRWTRTPAARYPPPTKPGSGPGLNPVTSDPNPHD